MTKKLLILIMAAVAVASAASKSYEVSIPGPTWIGTNELKAGTYAMQLQDNQVVLKMGKTVLTVPAKIEKGTQKHSSTALSTDNVGNKAVLREIEIGGTPTTVVFSAGSSATE
jgi:hypothetical protein